MSERIRITQNGIVINFEAAKNAFEPVPEGVYSAVLQKAEPRVSANGNDMVTFTLKVEGGEFAGRLLWHYVALLPQSAWHMVLVLEALTGVTYAEGELPNTWKELEGRTCTVWVAQTEWDGRIYNDVALYQAVSGAVAVTAPPRARDWDPEAPF